MPQLESLGITTSDVGLVGQVKLEAGYRITLALDTDHNSIVVTADPPLQSRVVVTGADTPQLNAVTVATYDAWVED